MKTVDYVILMVSATLCLVVLGMVGSLLSAIFDPSIPNEPILAVISPAFSGVIGGFIGMLAGVNLAQHDKEEEVNE
jgi:hypothetical protein